MSVLPLSTKTISSKRCKIDEKTSDDLLRLVFGANHRTHARQGATSRQHEAIIDIAFPVVKHHVRIPMQEFVVRTPYRVCKRGHLVTWRGHARDRRAPFISTTIEAERE